MTSHAPANALIAGLGFDWMLSACSSPSLRFLGREPLLAMLARIELDVSATGEQAPAIILCGVMGGPERDLATLAGFCDRAGDPLPGETPPAPGRAKRSDQGDVVF